MGNYNPHVPQILGQEWVPIRNEDMVFSPSVNSLEKGVGFTLNTSRQIRDARYYTHFLPPTMSTSQTSLVNIYPAGLEDLSGPIYEVMIPVSSGSITGSAINLSGASSVQDALYQSADNKSISVPLTTGLTQQRLRMQFDVAPYIQLANKRILNVSIIYAGSAYSINSSSVAFPYVTPDLTLPLTVARLVNGPSNMGDLQNNGFISNTGALSLNTNVSTLFNGVSPLDYKVLNLGDVNNWWNSAVVFPLTTSITEVLPWRYQDLLRFDESTAVGSTLGTMMLFQVAFQANVPADAASVQINLNYVALRVQYCEETRVAYGGFRGIWKYGTNIATIRNPSFTADPILPAGNYTATLSMVNPGDIDFTSQLGPDTPKLNAIRELYAIPTHPGMDINIPFPLEDRLGDTFEKITTHVIPQLTLHASGGTLLEPHVYGRQAVGQVYGSLTVTQEIHDGLAGGSTSWPWVRYVARRFGNTTVPLTLTGAGQSVSITPTEFDELDEILDGWKEVTLRFTTAPTMGAGTQPQFVWSAPGELAGNRWEVLGASAPAISGIPGNLLNLVPSPNQLGIATYGQPVSGSTINLGWIPQGVGSPWVTGTADDSTSDAFIIFAQDMPAVSGFTVTTLSQAVSGIGQDCGVDPCCIPTDILYNEITWTPFGISDNFDVDGVNGWPPTDTGETWTGAGGVAGDYSVSDGVGNMSFGAVSTGRGQFVLPFRTNSEVVVTFTAPEVPVGDNFTFVVDMRDIGFTDFTRALITLTSTNTVTLKLQQSVASVVTDLSSAITVLGLTTTTSMKIRVQASGTNLRAKIWAASEEEPSDWMLSGTTSVVAAGATLLLASVGAVSNTLPLVFTVDDFSSTPFVNGTFGYLELQRMDTVETDWQTIMKSTSDNIPTGFSDYEARVGIESSYRIRAVDSYDFPGPWSSTVTATIPAPGVSGGCLEDGHVLIFTSNERQDGSINLAYSSVWMDQQVEENFTFPEAGFVQLQLMYNKDFYTAFRPLERGGERFNRTVLVQAAAISPETLGNFTSLRDMAWDTVNYICVRDEDGNRWFATVLVPTGRVLRDRRLYLAPVDIVEVTTTPTPVNP